MTGEGGSFECRRSQQIAHVRVPHVVVVDGVDRVGDAGGERVPAQLRRVVRIEVVRAVLAGAGPVLDEVLVLVADDDGEVEVLLDPALGDRLDGPRAAISVKRENSLYGGGGEFAGVGQRTFPALDVVRHRESLGAN